MSNSKLDEIKALKANSVFPILKIAIPDGFVLSMQFFTYFSHLIEEINNKKWINLFYDPNSISIEREFYRQQSALKLNPKTKLKEGYIEPQLNTEIKTIDLEIIEAQSIVLETIEDIAIYAIANKKFLEFTIDHIDSKFELVGSLIAPFLNKSAYKSKQKLYNWTSDNEEIIQTYIYPQATKLKFVEQVNRFRTITIQGIIYTVEPDNYSVITEGEGPKLEHTFSGLMLKRSYFVTGFKAKFFISLAEYLDLKTIVIESIVFNTPLVILDGLNPLGVSSRQGFITELKITKGLQNQQKKYKDLIITEEEIDLSGPVEVTFMETSYYMI